MVEYQKCVTSVFRVDHKAEPLCRSLSGLACTVFWTYVAASVVESSSADSLVLQAGQCYGDVRMQAVLVAEKVTDL